IWGSHLVKTLRGYTSLDALALHEDSVFDAALLTVKAYDTEAALRELIKHIPDPPPVISLQNGLGNIEKLEALVGKARAIGGRVIFGVEFIEPGHVTVTVSADRTYIGSSKGGVDRSFVEHIASSFTNAGIPAEVTDDIRSFIWGKVLYNCALNPLATLLNVNYGKLLSCNETKQIMETIVQEIFLLAQARHIRLIWKKPEEFVKHLFEELIPKTFEHHPSMLQDIHRGKRTEIDALNGAVVTMGEQLDLDLPCNRTMAQLIKAKEQLC
ncbi:MAG: 2-dehydropantoate 2-reductase, partial [Pseudomonadota bacterium]